MSRSSITLSSATWIRSARSGSSLIATMPRCARGHQAEVDGLRVAERAALGDLDRVDVADQVGDGGVRGGQLLGVALAAVPPADRQVVAELGGAAAGRRGDRVVAGARRSRSPRSPASTRRAGRSSARSSRVLPWPRSPSRTTSWPAIRARSSWGSTVDSKPTMPGHGSRPARRAASRLSRISSLTPRRTVAGGAQRAEGAGEVCGGWRRDTGVGGHARHATPRRRARPSDRRRAGRRTQQRVAPGSAVAPAALHAGDPFRPHRGPARAPVRARRVQYVGGDGRAARDGRATSASPPSTAAWTISGYTVALAVATATHGRLADMLGIRLPLCLGVATMGVGAVAAALAPSFPVLMVARVLQGVGRRRGPGARDGPDQPPGERRDAQAAALGRIAGVAATLSALGPARGRGVGGRRRLAVGAWRCRSSGTLALPLLWRAAPAGGQRRAHRPAWARCSSAMAATGSGAAHPVAVGRGCVTAAVGGALLVLGVPAVGRPRPGPPGRVPAPRDHHQRHGAAQRLRHRRGAGELVRPLGGSAVPADRRGVALGVATLVFLVGASVGAALVGGLAEVVGVPVAFCLLVVLPVAGLVTLLLGGRADPAPAT